MEREQARATMFEQTIWGLKFEITKKTKMSNKQPTNKICAMCYKTE